MIITQHGIDSLLYRGNGPQRYSRANVPPNTRTKTEIDGEVVPAVPVDDASVYNRITNTVDNTAPMDDTSVENEITTTVDNTFPMDDTSVENEITGTVDNNFPLDITSVENEIAVTVDNTFPLDNPSLENNIVGIVNNNSPTDKTSLSNDIVGIVDCNSPTDNASMSNDIVTIQYDPEITFTTYRYAYLKTVGIVGYSPYLIELPNTFMSDGHIEIRATALKYTGTQTDSRMGVRNWPCFLNPWEDRYTSPRRCGLYTYGMITDDYNHNMDLVLDVTNGWYAMPLVQDPEHPDDPEAKVVLQIKDAIAVHASYLVILEDTFFSIQSTVKSYESHLRTNGNVPFEVTQFLPFGTPSYIGNVYGGDYYLHDKCFESAKAYDNNTLVVSLVPALRHNDDKIGILDEVSRTFWAFDDGNFTVSDYLPNQGVI